MLVRTKLFISLPLIAGAIFLSCRTFTNSELRDTDPAADEVNISILSLNDLHGGGLSENKKFSIGTPADRHAVKIGGPAAMKAYFTSIKAANPKGTLILDAGDSYQGSLVSNNSRGQAIASLYNYLGVDATAIGNHEFDWGGILAPAQFIQNNYESPFLRVVEKTNYPFLAHNMSFKTHPLEDMPKLLDSKGKAYNIRSRDGKSKIASYAMFERNGVKIAVIGAITENAMASSSLENYREVTIRPIGDGLAALIQSLRTKNGAQVVVLLMHAGFSCGFSQFDYQNDAANTSVQCPEVAAGSDEIRKVFAKITADGFAPGKLIDVVVAGHVHAPQAHYYEGVPVIQNADKGLGFGRVDIRFKKSDNAVTSRKIFPPALFCHIHFANYPGCDPKGPEVNLPWPASVGSETAPLYYGTPIDIPAQLRGANAALTPFKNLFEDMEKPITTLAEGLEHDRFKESALDRCYVDAIGLAANADLVIAISGGIRESLPKGVITAGHLFEVAPFDGGAVEVAMTGKELEAYIKMNNKDFNLKSMPIISEGWKLKVSCSAPGEAVTPLGIFVLDPTTNLWKNVEQTKLYKVVVSGYLFENPFFNDYRSSKSRVLQSDRDLLTAGFSRSDRPKSCSAMPQVVNKCDDSHAGSRWCGLTATCPVPVP